MLKSNLLLSLTIKSLDWMTLFTKKPFKIFLPKYIKNVFSLNSHRRKINVKKLSLKIGSRISLKKHNEKRRK